MSAIWPTKVRSADLPLLRRLHAAPKLVGHVPRVWKLVRRDEETLVAASRPEGADGLRWQSVLHAGQGMTLGGEGALGDVGAPVYRGQNIFPTGLIAAGVKRWDGTARVKMKRFHLYDSLLNRERLFAGRKIAQLPTVARVDELDAMFQDTVIAIQLATDLPLHMWVLGRPIQWYAAKLVRSGIVEDLGASWHKRQYLSLPAPPVEHADYSELKDAGRALLAADLDLADSQRHVDDALRASELTPISKLVASGDPIVSGFALANPLHQPVQLGDVQVQGTRLLAADGQFDLEIPDDRLRRFVAFQLRTFSQAGEAIALQDLVSIRVPRILDPVLEAIAEFETADRQAAFEQAHGRLDAVVGELIGLTAQEVETIGEAMRSEPFLREIKPNYAHRGFREQRLRPGGLNPYR